MDFPNLFRCADGASEEFGCLFAVEPSPMVDFVEKREGRGGFVEIRGPRRLVDTEGLSLPQLGAAGKQECPVAGGPSCGPGKLSQSASLLAPEIGEEPQREFPRTPRQRALIEGSLPSTDGFPAWSAPPE